MVLNFGGVPNIFGKEPFNLTELNIKRTPGEPTTDYNEGTIILNTADNKLYIALKVETTAITSPDLGWWKFDESSGNAADSSGSGHTLTNQSSATYAPGKYNNAASLDPGYFSTTDTAFDVSNYTFECWVKFDSLPNADEGFLDLVGVSGVYNRFYVTATKVLTFRAGGGGAAAALVEYNWSDLATGVWTHLAVSVDETNTIAKIYVNSELVASETYNTAPDFSTVTTKLGHRLAPIDALMDDAKFWTSIRSRDEINLDMTGQAGLNLTWGTIDIVA